ncbi:MAG: NAD(P)H-dependent glycerol-3-phosphate dehydrogenase [Proteobacteria bacterium]|nr:NAD(P)H-dependent glycerol-3-phosphate dehydrogenase [Pseudomonadota bacterium]
MKTSVIGAGSFGTALSNLISSIHREVILWVYENDVFEEILTKRENSIYMPGIKLNENIKPTRNIEEAVRDIDVLVLAVPSHVLRNVLNNIKPFISEKTILVSVAKGIENTTNFLMAEVIESVLGENFANNICVLSGPSFAKEVAEKKPTLVVVASRDLKKAEIIQKNFSNEFFRIYTSDDIIGVELGGAVKNVIAIAAGISEGMSLGYNAMAALITRGLAEMTRLGVAMGANPLTFKGLSGVGDLVLTCTGSLSRNRQVGIKLAQGMKINDIEGQMRMVAEGVKTSKAVKNLAEKYGVEMPISESVYNIIYNGYSPTNALKELMQRQLKFEREFVI